MMNKIKKFPIWILLLLVTVLCNPDYKSYAQEPKSEVTILFTHDLHDNLLPAKSLEDGKLVSQGGYARLQSAINTQKEKDPEALLVDAGDFSMGTPFQTIFQSDAPELRMLGLMGYDVVTFGNHEYDYRASGLTESLLSAIQSNEHLPQVVQSNVEFPVDEEGNLTDTLTDLKLAMKEYGVSDYTVLERNGIKIGVFGLMGEESASMAPMSEVTFRDKVKEAKRVVKLLKEEEQVQFILCLSHSGTDQDSSKSEDEILAKQVEGIDVIISGHSHTKLSKPIIVGNTVIGSAEDYGKSLGVIKMKQTQEGWKLGSYELIPIDQSISEDSTIAARVSSFKEIVQEKYFSKFGLAYDEIVAFSDIQFQTPEEIDKIHGEATIGNLVSDAYIYSVKKAEGEAYVPIAAAIVPCGTIRSTIFQGGVTTADAFSISSLGIGADGMPGYPLISVYLTGKELKTVCEVDASIAPIMSEAQLYISGIKYTFHPNRLIFNKVTKTALIDENGKAESIEDSKLYRIVCNLYSAQMLSVVGDKSYGLMSVIPKSADGNSITDFEDYIIYQSNGGTNTELKEWYAVVQYLQSFDKSNEKSIIPAYYASVQNRKTIDHSKNIMALISNPNRIALTVYIAVPLLLGALLSIIVLITKRIKRRRARRRS